MPPDRPNAPEAAGGGGLVDLTGPRNAVATAAGTIGYEILTSLGGRHAARPRRRAPDRKAERMKIVVLGSGVIGATSAWYLAAAGHEVIVLDRQPGPGARDELRQCRRGLARLRLALGRPRHSAEGAQVAVHAPQLRCSSARASTRRCWRFGLAMLRNCTAARYAVNKSRMVPLAEYSRDMLRALRAETGIAYDERTQGTLQLFRTEKLLTGAAKDVAGPARARRAARASRRRRLRRGRAGAGPGPGEVRRRPAAAQRRDRRLLQVHRTRCATSRRRAASTSATASTIERPRRRRRPPRPASDQRQGLVTGDAYVAGARQLLAAAAAAARHRPAGLPGQGLLADRADHRPGRRAGVDRDGREAQGGDHPARRPHPRRRHGRARRLHRPRCTPRRRDTLEHVVSDLYPAGGDAEGGSLLVRACGR